MSHLRYEGDNDLKRARAYHRREQNSHKMKADAIDAELNRRNILEAAVRSDDLPECYASNPGAQARAENDCERCPHETRCTITHTPKPSTDNAL